MARIFMHCPLNISRTLVSMIVEFCQQLQANYGIEVMIETQPHRPTEESPFKSYIENDTLPDMTIGHINDFADMPEGYLEEHFLQLPGRYPLRRELDSLGFSDQKGYFHPFVVIPFAMFYNHNLLSENDIPRSWGDLLDSKWDKQILMPDEYRMVSVITKAFMETDFPDNTEELNENIIHQGSPLEVVKAVDEGIYPIGITNIAFARISRHKNTRIIWPQDGLFCMPQVMVWSRNAAEPMLEVGNYLLSRPVQEYLALQSFVPASSEVVLPRMVSDNDCNLRWKGWDSFLEVIKGRNV